MAATLSQYDEDADFTCEHCHSICDEITVYENQRWCDECLHDHKQREEEHEEDAGLHGSLGGRICDICNEAPWTTRLVSTAVETQCHVAAEPSAT